MFNHTLTLMDIEMDRYRPSIDRHFGPSVFAPMPSWKAAIEPNRPSIEPYAKEDRNCEPIANYKIPNYKKDINGNLYDDSDYKQKPKYKTDLNGNLYDSNDPYCMKPIGYINRENKIVDLIRPDYPLGSIDKGY